jgi:hypothetical protein
MKIIRLLRNSIGTATLAGALLLAAPHSAQASVFISVGIAPPPIPVYVQPVIPGEGYIWTPGYWAWTGEGYEWVDGAWVMPPYVGALWTPGYWGWGNNRYFWNAGYWGPTVGYYGGINYGFGYFGTGFYGGYWNHRHFYYNRGYNNFGGHRGFRNVYDRPVHGFNGRPGGSSFTRHSQQNIHINRAANINGRNFGNHNVHGTTGTVNHGFANAQRQHNVPSANHGVVAGQHNFPNGNSNGNRFGNSQHVYNGAQSINRNGAQSFNRGGNAAHSFNQPTPRSYSQPSRNFGGQNRSFSHAPASRPNFGGGNGASHGNMGGNFHGGGGGFHGGGGNSHGGGGGGSFHGGRR